MNKSIDIAKKSIIRRANKDVPALEYDKLQPQVKECEEAVLGAIMIEKDSILEVDFLTPEMFYFDAHQKLFSAIQILKKEDKGIELITVTEQLKKEGQLESVGGAYFIAVLTNKIGSAAHISDHARYVQEAFVKRQLISISSQTLREAYEDTTDVFDLLENTEKSFANVRNGILGSQMDTLADQMEMAVKAMTHEGSVSSKHEYINLYCNGWEKKVFNIIAGKPGTGKSAIMVSESIHLLLQGAKVAIFSLEMSEGKLIPRMLSNLTQIPIWLINKSIKDGGFENPSHEERYQTAYIQLRGYEDNLMIDFSGTIKLDALINKIKKRNAEKGLDVVFIDFLKYIELSQEEKKGLTRDQEIGVITKRLKSTAKTQNICIVLFCQLNRPVKTLNGDEILKKPELTDLRDSGNLENDGDTIIILRRPEMTFDRDAETNRILTKTEEEYEMLNTIEAYCLKNKENSPWYARWNCQLEISTISDKH